MEMAKRRFLFQEALSDLLFLSMSIRNTGLALHGARVALTPARALTSHLRRRYQRHYEGRYPRAAWVFGFDLFLLGACATLLFLNVWLAIAVPQVSSGIHVMIYAPPLKTATPQALEAHLVSQDGKRHEHVSFIWDLPPNTEVLSAVPSLTQDHEVMIDALEPGVTTTLRVAVRFFVPESHLRVAVKVRDEGREFSGGEERAVVGSGMTLEPLMNAVKAFSGARTPFLLKNTSPVDLPNVEVVGGSVYRQDMAEEPSAFTLAPLESRLVFVDPLSSGVVHIRAQGVTLLTRVTALEREGSGSIPRVSLPITTPGAPAAIETSSSEPFRLFVAHPALKGESGFSQVFDLPSGQSSFVLPLEKDFAQAVEKWFAIPFQSDASGHVTLFPLVKSRGTTAFSLSSVARYYTSSGDQLGIGPLPPIVGQTTKYWIHWQIDPVQRDLSRATLRAALGPGVVFTGRTALPDGGDLKQDAGTMEWSLPFIPAGIGPLSASFEVAFTPTGSMRKKTAVLLEQGEGQALENRYETWIQTLFPAVDTRLAGDVRAEGSGVVR